MDLDEIHHHACQATDEIHHQGRTVSSNIATMRANLIKEQHERLRINWVSLAQTRGTQTHAKHEEKVLTKPLKTQLLCIKAQS